VRAFLLVLLLIALPAAAPVAADEPQPFERGSWQSLRLAHAGRPMVVHLWGLTCGPCLVELPRWGELRRERPDLDLVLIAADPVPEEPARAAATLAKAGLGRVESWMFADRFAERLRYEVDPQWHGELPRTMLIDRTGAVTVLPGIADLARVRGWLDRQARGPAG
jgi:thiol-disulfide isomerase/thioredoxin